MTKNLAGFTTEPGPSHRVCSAHCVEGKKTYSNNIPTVFSTSSHTPRKSPAPRIPESNNPVSELKITPPTCTHTLTSENDSNTQNEDT